MKMNKRALCIVVWAAVLPAAYAASPPGFDGLIRCAGLDDPGQRLACYDRELAPHVTAQRPGAATPPVATAEPALAPGPAPIAPAPAAPVAPVAQAPAPQPPAAAPAAPAPAAPVVAQAPVQPPATPPAAAPAPVRTLGEEQLPASRRPAPQAEELALTARITALNKAGSAYLVSLDNGQIWRHENSVLGAYLKVGEPVTITRAALGSYRLTRDAGQTKNWIRVSRVR